MIILIDLKSIEGRGNDLHCPELVRGSVCRSMIGLDVAVYSIRVHIFRSEFLMSLFFGEVHKGELVLVSPLHRSRLTICPGPLDLTSTSVCKTVAVLERSIYSGFISLTYLAVMNTIAQPLRVVGSSGHQMQPKFSGIYTSHSWGYVPTSNQIPLLVTRGLDVGHVYASHSQSCYYTPSSTSWDELCGCHLISLTSALAKCDRWIVPRPDHNSDILLLQAIDKEILNVLV